MPSNEQLMVAIPQARDRADLRPGFGPNLRVLLMLGVCGFPLMTLYALADSRRATAHAVSSAVVSKVRIGRMAGDHQLLVRSPLPQPVAPKPQTPPIR